MEFSRVVGTRRSHRWFKTWEPVSDANIQRILEAVRLTTSPGNLQPWRAVVVRRDQLDEETREELLKASNWQGAHVQAPVWMYFYGDPEQCEKDCYVKTTADLLDIGAIFPAYGWNMERIKAAVYEGVEAPEGMASLQELVALLTPEIVPWIAYSETVGACAQATLAATNEGLGCTLHMIAKPSMQDRVKEILGVPARCMPVWVLLVGHPAESIEAGGQRIRDPWDSMFFSRTWGNPFPRDDDVVEKLKAEGMIQPPAPLPQRWEELRFLSRMYGYPED